MVFRISAALAIAIALSAFAWALAAPGDAEARALSFSLLAGAGFGVVLQRGRFCFWCNFRDFFETRRADGLLAIVVALAAGVVFYQIVIMAWVPVPQPGRLPPTAHIGPVGPVLAFAAFVFGLGMAISGSCLSAHFYRLGEGAFGSLAALFGAGLGFLLGFLSWNRLYTWTVFDDVPIWLPHHLGYAGALALALTVLALLALVILARGRLDAPAAAPAGREALAPALEAVFVRRWPPVLTGVLVAAISAFAYFRVAPLGVTAELGSLARTGGTWAGLVPETLAGLDVVRGCISAVKTALLSRNGVFVVGLVLASLAAAVAAGQFRPSFPGPGGLAARFAGGVLMGWGGMTALGCTVGVLLSGIHAGAVSGWVFLVFCSLGAFAGLKLRRLAAA